MAKKNVDGKNQMFAPSMAKTKCSQILETIDGKRVTSCWVTNIKGFLTIKPSKKVEWEARIDTLKQEIQRFIDNPLRKT